MSKIISVANPKGGVGKTITSINLAAALAYLNQKVLLIDLDPKADASKGLGIDTSFYSKNIYSIMLEKYNIQSVIVKTIYDNLDIIIGSTNLASFDLESANIADKENILKESIEQIKNNYDYIIIDCPPSLSTLTQNAFACSNSVLIPMQCEFFSMEIISQLLNTILNIQRSTGNGLQIEGVLLTMCDFRTKIAISVQQEVRQIFKDKVYSFGIPRNIKLVESTYKGRPIIDYDSKCNSAKNYILLAKASLPLPTFSKDRLPHSGLLLPLVKFAKYSVDCPGKMQPDKNNRINTPDQ